MLMHNCLSLLPGDHRFDLWVGDEENRIGLILSGWVGWWDGGMALPPSPQLYNVCSLMEQSWQLVFFSKRVEQSKDVASEIV